MKICTFSIDGAPLRPGALRGDDVVDLSRLAGDLSGPAAPHAEYYGPGNWMARFVAPEGREAIARVLADDEDGRYPTRPSGRERPDRDSDGSRRSPT